MKDTRSNLGSSVDALFELRAERLELERQVKKLKARETELKTILIGAISDQNLTGARGNIATVSLQPKVVPTVENWSEVEDYILDNRCLYLLQRRIATPAYIERLENGIQVPGITPTTITNLSLTKAKR